jgi:hypothetical protein
MRDSCGTSTRYGTTISESSDHCLYRIVKLKRDCTTRPMSRIRVIGGMFSLGGMVPFFGPSRDRRRGGGRLICVAASLLLPEFQKLTRGSCEPQRTDQASRAAGRWIKLTLKFLNQRFVQTRGFASPAWACPVAWGIAGLETPGRPGQVRSGQAAWAPGAVLGGLAAGAAAGFGSIPHYC